jgi:DNA-binding transcriptional ArsR family regulator
MAYAKAIAALADPTRLQVFEKLRKGPAAVGALAQGLRVSRPAVSQHLKVLEGAGLVSARKQGTRRIYQVEVQGLVELRRYLDQFWGETFKGAEGS